jgi:hypothetical protein
VNGWIPEWMVFQGMKIAPFEIVKSYQKGIEWYREHGINTYVDFGG